MSRTAPNITPTQPKPRFSLGLLDFRVLREDLSVIILGTVATLTIALPIGYATDFLVAPRMPEFSLIDDLVNIAQIVLFEEILFRALLFGGLCNRVGRASAAIVSAFIFGALHLIQFPLPMAVMATWAGIVLALQYYRTRRISTPMLTHALLIVTELFVLPPTGG